MLAALIVRGVSFEFRGKRDSARWRAGWDWALAVGSLVPAFAWGVAFTDLVHGLRLSRPGCTWASFWDLLAPVAVVGGLASLALFLAHGATFLSLKTTGPLAARARTTAMWCRRWRPPLVAGTAAWLAAGGSHGPGCLPGAGADRAGRRVRAGLRRIRRAGLGRPGRRRVRAERAGHRGRRAPRSSPRCSRGSWCPRGPGPSLTIWSAASAH